MPARRKAATATAVRCYTRAAKNARFLQEAAPGIFARDPAEHAIERLVTRAWAERQVITVFALDHDPQVPVTIVVRRAPEPFQH